MEEAALWWLERAAQVLAVHPEPRGGCLRWRLGAAGDEATAPWWAARVVGAQRALGFCQILCHPFWGSF